MLETPIAADTQRNYWGWISITFIVMLLMFAAWTNNAARKPDRLGGFEEQEALLKRAMSANSLEESLTSTSKKPHSAADDIVSKSLDDTISGLVLATDKHPMAAMLYAEMRTLQKESVPEDRLAGLKKSSHPEDKAFYEIYTSPSLTRAKADELIAKFPPEPFVYTAAKVQALEKSGDKAATQKFISPMPIIMLGILELAIWPFLGLSIAVWMILLRKSRDGTLEPKGIPLETITAHDADRLAVRAAQIIVVFLALGVVIEGLSYLLKLNLPAEVPGAIAGLLTIASIFALQYLPVDGKQLLLRDLGLTADNWGTNVMLGFLGFVAELPVTIMLGEFTTRLLKWLPQATHPATEALSKNHDLKTLIPILIAGSIVAPFWEELVFRGMLFPGMNRLLGGLVPAIVLSSLVFASVHPQGITIWVSLAFVGASSCFLSRQSRSLVPSMVMHCMHNTALFVIVMLS
jgi:membrane protease YdiL (CAAX protease family)